LSLEINSGIEEELSHYQFLFSVFIHWTKIERFGPIRFSVQGWPRSSRLLKEVKLKELRMLWLSGFWESIRSLSEKIGFVFILSAI